MVALVRDAERAGLAARVPTTPDWSVRRLVAHQGMVHRWAAATVCGRVATETRWEHEGATSPDPVEWLRDGAIEVVTAIASAPADLVAPVFLADAPPPRAFWARRQCHETTVHAVDALSAALGRYPRAADATWISPVVALDGIRLSRSGATTVPADEVARLAEGLFGAQILDELLRVHRLTVVELQALISRVMDAYAAEASPPPNRAIRRSQRRTRST